MCIAQTRPCTIRCSCSLSPQREIVSPRLSGLLFMFLFLFLLCRVVVSVQGHYHHTWAVKLNPGADPDKVADQLHMVNLGPIGNLPNYYIFKLTDHPRYSPAPSVAVTESIVRHKHVRSATQQRVLHRAKRD